MSFFNRSERRVIRDVLTYDLDADDLDARQSDRRSRMCSDMCSYIRSGITKGARVIKEGAIVGALGATGGIIAVSLANPALSIAAKTVVVAGAAIGATQIVVSIAIGLTAKSICEYIDASDELKATAIIILGLFGAIVAAPYLLGLAGMHFTRNVIFLSEIVGLFLTGSWMALKDK